MGFWVYVLRCADGSYYAGHTDNLAMRLAEHAAGQGGRYTAARRPVTLVFSEDCDSHQQALARERQLKGWSRRKKEALIRGDWGELSRLGRRGKPEGEAQTTRFSAQETPARIEREGADVSVQRPESSRQAG